MSKPSPASFESRSRASRGLPPHRECEGSSFVFVSSVVEKDIFELGAGSALHIWLQEGEEIPHEALGRSLQAHLDFWALARGPGGLATQVQASPSRSQTPTPSRAHPKVIEGQLPTSKATKPPSSHPLAPSRDQPVTREGRIMSVKVTHPPPHTSETLELDLEPKLAFETLQVAFETLRVAFETLRATFKQPSRPSG
ncbi:hypothetical protein EDD15DRAFT_2371868 [Pisolithus albus]|nr:hypothetical protein EDD15DRAFT_2371868 [Pisolithus albus]